MLTRFKSILLVVTEDIVKSVQRGIIKRILAVPRVISVQREIIVHVPLGVVAKGLIARQRSVPRESTMTKYNSFC